MQARCAGAAHAFEAWRKGATQQTAPSPSERSVLVAFIESGFGLPTAPRSEDHVQGHVAELVWYLVTLEQATGSRTLRRIEPPSFHVSSPGGDGLVVYERDDGGLIFRLWEVKKHTGKARLSRTTNRAYSQLKTHAPRYLAQYTAAGSGYPPALGAIYAKLVDLWLEAAEPAGAGVAVATSRTHSPQRCFSAMSKHLPELSRPGQLEGLVAAIGDFPAFSRRVQEFVWSGLST